MVAPPAADRASAVQTGAGQAAVISPVTVHLGRCLTQANASLEALWSARQRRLDMDVWEPESHFMR